jgi:hypothetical protein
VSGFPDFANASLSSAIACLMMSSCIVDLPGFFADLGARTQHVRNRIRKPCQRLASGAHGTLTR